MKVRELYEKVGRMSREGMGETSKVCRCLISTLANEYTDAEVLDLMKRYRVRQGKLTGGNRT